MPLDSGFDPRVTLLDAPPTKSRPRRPAPFSLRLSEDERRAIEAQAQDVPLGAYIKWRLLDGAPLPAPQPKRRVRRPGRPVEDQVALGRTLALLGSSRIASNLNQLAYAAHVGALAVDPETVAALNEAVALVREIRALLVGALGLKAEAAS